MHRRTSLENLLVHGRMSAEYLTETRIFIFLNAYYVNHRLQPDPNSNIPWRPTIVQHATNNFVVIMQL